jgi:hypothetical protein
LSCDKQNPKPILIDYIYPISYKIAKSIDEHQLVPIAYIIKAKGANPGKRFCPLGKTISQIF